MIKVYVITRGQMYTDDHCTEVLAVCLTEEAKDIEVDKGLVELKSRYGMGHNWDVWVDLVPLIGTSQELKELALRTIK